MIAVEIILLKISHTKHIDGITYATNEFRSESFEDDASIFVKRNPQYLKELCGNLETICKDLRAAIQS